MNTPARCVACAFLVASGIAQTTPFASADAQASAYTPRVTPAHAGCTPKQRRAALWRMQSDVLHAVPEELSSLPNALEPGGPLAGWSLSHGYVVLATAGAVVVDNLTAQDPLPHLLLYAPSRSSAPADWLDFSGPDDPYRLVGWAYTAPYTPGSTPPRRPCIAPAEWLVHEAGWHLKDGGMHLTPGAAIEPARPPGLAIHMWHPRVWDIHVWRNDEDVPTIAFANANAPGDGRDLPQAAFFYLVNGRPRFPVASGR